MRDQPRRDAAEYDGWACGLQRHRDDRESRKQRSSCCQHLPVRLRALKDVRHGLGVPLATACRRHTSGVQGLRNFSQRGRACFLSLPDDWKDVGRISVGFSLDGSDGILAGHVEPWVAKGGTARLCGSKSLPCPCRDEAQLFLCDGSEEVQDEGVCRATIKVRRQRQSG